MYTINAITPLLNPEISDQEAREVVAGLTDEQKSIAILYCVFRGCEVGFRFSALKIAYSGFDRFRLRVYTHT